MRLRLIATIVTIAVMGLLLANLASPAAKQQTGSTSKAEVPVRYNSNEAPAACTETDASNRNTGNKIAEGSSCGKPIAKIAPGGSRDLTLLRSRDYRLRGGNVDCPDCKNLECAEFAPPDPKARIVETTFRATRNSGHWFRCGVQSICGRAEFSDPAQPQQDCKGKASCWICRAVNDGREAEDDITFSWQ